MYALMYMYYRINFTGGQISYRANLIYVQAENTEVHGDFSINIPKKRIKKEVCKNLTKSHHLCINNQRKYNWRPELKYVLDSDASLLRNRKFCHSFFRNTIDAPFPSYSRFCASFTESLEKHKVYFDVTLPTPPNKTTVYDVMLRCRKAAEFKSMPFVQIVGDQPVYALILDIKNENPVLFESILPVLGGFHTACAFLSVIYRRFKRSGLEDHVVAAGMIEPGSVDDAIKG